MPESSDKPLNINEILNLVQEANKSLETIITVPSTKKEISLKSLNALHAKNLVKSTAVSIFQQNQFNLIIVPILKDILGVKTLHDLNIYDKNIILLNLRIKNNSDKLSVQFVNGDESQKFDSDISLTDILSKLEHPLFQDKTVESFPYILHLNFPSIEEEYAFESFLFEKHLSSIDENDQKSLRCLVAPLYITNIAQYIKKLIIGDKEINLSKKSIKDRINIVESLPANLLLDTIKEIDNVFGKALQKITQLSLDKDEEKYSANIEIGAKLFVVN